MYIISLQIVTVCKKISLVQCVAGLGEVEILRFRSSVRKKNLESVE